MKIKQWSNLLISAYQTAYAALETEKTSLRAERPFHDRSRYMKRAQILKGKKPLCLIVPLRFSMYRIWLNEMATAIHMAAILY